MLEEIQGLVCPSEEGDLETEGKQNPGLTGVMGRGTLQIRLGVGSGATRVSCVRDTGAGTSQAIADRMRFRFRPQNLIERSSRRIFGCVEMVAVWCWGYRTRFGSQQILRRH